MSSNIGQKGGEKPHYKSMEIRIQREIFVSGKIIYEGGGKVTLENKSQIISFPSDSDLDFAGIEKGYLSDREEVEQIKSIQGILGEVITVKVVWSIAPLKAGLEIILELQIRHILRT